MSYRTFYISCGLLILLLIGMGAYVGFTQPNNECVPSVTIEGVAFRTVKNSKLLTA